MEVGVGGAGNGGVKWGVWWCGGCERRREVGCVWVVAAGECGEREAGVVWLAADAREEEDGGRRVRSSSGSVEKGEGREVRVREGS